MARYDLAQLQNLLRSVGWPEDQIAKMAAIGIYESGGRTDVVNDGSSTNSVEYSVGLFQINTKAHNYSVEQLKDPAFNAQVALKLWRNRTNYGDWYNSNIKYSNNYQGIAAQSRAIYNGGGNSVIGTAQIQQIINSPTGTVNNTSVSGSEIAIYAAAGLLVIALLRN